MTDIMGPLVESLVRGDKDGAVKEASQLQEEGVPMERIVLEGIEVAMTKMDAKCTMDDFNLLEIMLVGRAAMEVMKVVVPSGVIPPTSKCTVVLATPEGDVHDLGKNIVKTIFTGKGYRVIDCGKDCPIDTMISSALKEKADAIGVSGLITSVVPMVKSLRPALRDAGLGNVKLLAGGAALCQASAIELDVDYVATNVFTGAKYLESSGGD
jgi:methylmalonyl-CoA mutase cobalamin-binding domain/chain